MTLLRRYGWTLGLTGAVMAVGFAIRVVLRGHVDERAWLLAVGGAALLLAWSAIDGEEPEDRGWRRVGGSGGLLVLALIAGSMLVEGAQRLHIATDLASDAVPPLAPVTLARLDALDEDLVLTAVFSHGSAAQQAMKRRLDPIAAASPRVRVAWLDPLRSPLEAERLGVKRESGELIFALGERRTRLVGRLDEAAIDATIARLASTEPRVGCWVRDHGEPDPDDLQQPEGFGKAVLAAEAFDWTFRPVSLAQPVPAECDVVLLIATAGVVPPAHGTHLRDAYAKGQGLLVLAEPGGGQGLDQALRPLGASIGEGIVLGQRGGGVRLGSDDPALLVLPPGSAGRPHPLSRGLAGPVVFALARPVEVVDPSHAAPLLTVPEAQGVAQLSDGATPEPRRQGEDIGVGVVLTEEGDGPEDAARRAVILGDAGFATNRALPIGAHEQLWLDALAWVSGDEIFGRRAAGKVEPLVLTTDQGMRIALLSLLGIPGGFALAGLAVWWRRRRL